MHACTSTNIGVPMIKSYGTEAVADKYRRIIIEPKLTGMPDIDPLQLPEVLYAIIVRLSFGDNSNLKFLANLSDITFGIAPESNKP